MKSDIDVVQQAIYDRRMNRTLHIRMNERTQRMLDALAHVSNEGKSVCIRRLIEQANVALEKGGGA